MNIEANGLTCGNGRIAEQGMARRCATTPGRGRTPLGGISMAQDNATGRFAKQDPVERFWAFVRKTESCWLWQGWIDTTGYGRFWLDGRNVGAHQAVILLTEGRPIPEGLEPDHLCRVRACVRYPGHLELVTRKENARRRTVLITHCPRGHPYSPENTYITKANSRVCRKCQVLAQQRYLARLRERA